MPSNREDLLEAVTEAARSGVIVLVVTQCAHGGVSGDYETGQALLDAGAIPGSDITQVSRSTLGYNSITPLNIVKDYKETDNLPNLSGQRFQEGFMTKS